jgi:phosphoribosylformylglycinamidine synthase
MGKYIELDVAADSAAEAAAEVKRMCEELLANTVIEDYRFEVEGA